MTNSVEDPTPSSRKDVFVKYLQYYEKVCGNGALRVCSDTQVTDEARRVEPRKRFHAPPPPPLLLDFHETLLDCVQDRGCQTRLGDLRKAAEVLELLCVNLFLFPWKKEIKTLKTFTGQFVYYIKPVLPFAQSILQIIGYYMETDDEYRLSDNFDPSKAQSIGFDLFLVRLECEDLLELMNQKSNTECLEILRTRAALLTVSAQDDVSKPTSDIHNQNDVITDSGHVECDSLVNQGEQRQYKSLKSHNSHDQEIDLQSEDGAISDVERPPGSFLTDDRSILEMRENYPDLAIRQKPIFPKSQRSMQPLKTQENPGCRGLFHEVSTDISGPQSIAIHIEITSGHRRLNTTNALVEAQPLDTKPLSLEVGRQVQGCSPEDSMEDCLVELTEQMAKMQMKELCADEPLKYPIEETAQAQPCFGNDAITVPPTKPSDAMSLPILCSPTQDHVCNISGCGSCVGSNGTIKEPPHSVYIPSMSVFGPPTQTVNDDSSASKNPTSQQPEDEIEQTYVMV